MEKRDAIIKTIEKSYNTKIGAGIAWLKFICGVNNIVIAKRELELLAFVNFRGTISSTSSKEEFCRIFESSIPTVTNMTSKLMKMKLLVKEEKSRKIRINPALQIDFNKDLVVKLHLKIIPNDLNQD